jgi:hypothetical protein
MADEAVTAACIYKDQMKTLYQILGLGSNAKESGALI